MADEKIIEPTPEPESRTDSEELAYRLRQQSVVAEFGRCAMAASDISVLLNEAVRLCAEGMNARYCKALEYSPEDKLFYMRAGIGWEPRYIGSATTSADTESPTGFAYHTGRSITSNHLENEGRFRTPQILIEHGVRRAINVVITVGADRRWGVIEADSPDEGKFDEADIAFMESIAHLLGAAMEREENADTLRRSEQQFRVLANSLPHLVWVCDEAGAITWLNQRWYEFTGKSPDEALGWGWRQLDDLGVEETTTEEFLQFLKTGEPWELSFGMRGASGQHRWFLTRALPIRDDSGRIVNWVGTNTDITERRAAEELQRTMTREASHRIKNSLAMVSSLLNLQASTLKDEARRELREAASRIYTMAAVHDQLWRKADARDVELAAFLADLCSSIATTSPRHETIATIEPVVVSADQAAPIGLLINELITNAYKYAYPQDENGTVHISGEHAGSARYRLVVADDGQGLPEDFDLSKPGSRLGMRIVKSLARQINADLSAENGRTGARFTLLFPL